MNDVINLSLWWIGLITVTCGLLVLTVHVLCWATWKIMRETDWLVCFIQFVWDRRGRKRAKEKVDKMPAPQTETKEGGT